MDLALLAERLQAAHGDPPSSWSEVLSTLQRAGYTLEEESLTVGLQARAERVLADLAPPGTPLTPELDRQVRTATEKLMVEELIARGMDALTAAAFTKLLVSTLKIKARPA